MAISPSSSTISMPSTPDSTTLARFFFVSDPDGYKIEVIQKGGRFG